jgi:hypothetical protein
MMETEKQNTTKERNESNERRKWKAYRFWEAGWRIPRRGRRRKKEA